MKPIVLYLRVSTLDQNVDSQREDLINWCLLNNFNIVSVFGETVSGYDTTAERLQYELMKKYVVKNNVKDIVVWEISRLSRSLLKTVNELDYYSKLGINVHFRKENLESLSNNVTNQLLLSILSSMAQMERDTFIERGNRGRMSSAIRGKNIGFSTLPYGYTSIDKVLVVDETESKIIRLIFDMTVKGETLYNIGEHLNSMGVPTRRTLQKKVRTLSNGDEKAYIWQLQTIRSILKRSLYKGLRVFKGVEINVPAIVSVDVWNKAQERFEKNIGYHNRTKYEYLFKSMLRCSKCGRILVTYKNKDTPHSYYLCSGLNDKLINCDNGKYINSHMIDEHLYKALFTHHFIDEILHRQATPAIEIELKRNQITYYSNEVQESEMKRKRFNKLYTDGHIDYDEYNKEITALKNNTTDIKNKINVLNGDIEIMSQIDIEDIIKKYKTTEDFNIKREFVIKHVNSIKVYKLAAANLEWQHPLELNEKIIYVELFAFNWAVPIKVLLTPHSRNVIISKNLNYIENYDMVVDVSK